jgi:alpha-1,2-mannosyltransferase
MLETACDRRRSTRETRRIEKSIGNTLGVSLHERDFETLNNERDLSSLMCGLTVWQVPDARLESGRSLMKPPVRRDFWVIYVLCGFFGLLGWAFYLIAFSREPSQDWMVFYTAARAYWEDNLPLIFEGDQFTAVINDRFSTWLSWPLPLHPWLYPPDFLIYLLPFGLIPPAPACALFLLTGFTFVVAALFTVARDARQRWIYATSLALCPATAITVCLGQNAFLTSALLVGGFGLVRHRPMLGGALLGILSFKPQLCLLVPFALIAAGQWRPFTSAVAAALLLFLASLLVFGTEPWRLWLDLMTRPNAVYESWVTIGRLNGQSVYANAALLGASKGVANLAQALAFLFAACSVIWAFRRPIAPDLQLAVLLAATMLAAPHIIGYDAVMLAIGATLLFCRALDEHIRFGEAMMSVLAWLSPLVNPPSVFWPGLFTPLIVTLFIGCVILRAVASSPARRTAPGMVSS